MELLMTQNENTIIKILIINFEALKHFGVQELHAYWWQWQETSTRLQTRKVQDTETSHVRGVK